MTDNFFDLGGDSFLVVMLCEQLGEEFIVNIPTVSLFEFTTVSGQAGYITRISNATESLKQRIDRREKLSRRRIRSL